ncbi:hypothetical protein K7432_018096 [Basidiobolus ranarum]|uniref:Retrotransposon gag domain-containing protein n=1 Tax=Basidiobolus ranarum TaxID=34480 RepID=A0ABR2VJL5_9FUNG
MSGNQGNTEMPDAWMTTVTDILVELKEQAAGQGARIPVKIATYHGTPSENVVAWLIQTEQAFNTKSISEDKKVAAIGSYLQDLALSWYHGRLLQAEAQNTTAFPSWSAFKTNIKAFFLPPNFQLILRTQLENCWIINLYSTL